MDIYTFERLIKSESAARRYVLGFCFKNQQRICPRCRCRKLWKLADGKRRCSRCRYSFHDLTGRWIGITTKKVRRGSLVYTDKYKAYDALMFCGYRHLAVDHQTRFANGKVYINGLAGFWSWAKQRLIKHHGISPRWFPFYLKELEFRYNHRHEDIFSLIVKFLCDQVPYLE